MGKKILLADDSITIQKVIELTFSDEDFDVVTVGNGRLAVEKAQEVRPDIVLCDIIMPEKDGYEVCDFIKRHPGLSHVPVLLLTGAFEPFDQERATRVGCDGFLAKPFEPQTLIAKVKDLLSQAGARRPAAAPSSATRPMTGPAPVPPPAAPAPTPAAFMTPPPSFSPPPSPFPERAEEPSFIPDEPMVEDAMAATFADAMELEPEPEPEPEPVRLRKDAPVYTAATLVPQPSPFTPEPAGLGTDDDLLPVTAEESETLSAPVGDAASGAELPSPSPWGQQPTVEVPLEMRAQASVSMAEAEGVFEEVFEDETATMPPRPAAPLPFVPPPPPVTAPPPPAPRVATFVPPPPPPEPVRLPTVVPEPAPAAEVSFAGLNLPEPPSPPPAPASVAAEVAVPMDMVEKIAQRVVAHISEKVVREIAWEVIPDLAEALIKKEIERLKAELQQLQ